MERIGWNICFDGDVERKSWVGCCCVEGCEGFSKRENGFVLFWRSGLLNELALFFTIRWWGTEQAKPLSSIWRTEIFTTTERLGVKICRKFWAVKDSYLDRCVRLDLRSREVLVIYEIFYTQDKLERGKGKEEGREESIENKVKLRLSVALLSVSVTRARTVRSLRAIASEVDETTARHVRWLL